jgi:hypothetical protein
VRQERYRGQIKGASLPAPSALIFANDTKKAITNHHTMMLLLHAPSLILTLSYQSYNQHFNLQPNSNIKYGRRKQR